MNEPIPIYKDNGEKPQLTAAEYAQFAKARHERRVQWVFLGFIGVIVLGFMVPLVAWLTRIALGA